MANRWQMNRMGFINFWLYDDEVFQFSEGRLLLRGANASGKSVTTQSIIPFILDGDRTPSRLDTFGSGSRKMEYYFLGNGEKEDVTGYLFLEFKKQGVDQYRTIGIGQRAQRGKPMDFWGFIILDNRRIGKELSLYKEVGDTRLPHTRQTLKNLLGEANPLVTRQREYMELVNKYIFAFPRLEQYEQFIQLMIKVRAPKLSRDFKPSDIYQILNGSLQTLSDADLRPMVEAMEKMDDIQARLEGLRTAFKSLKMLRKEYDRYTIFIRAQKGRTFIQCHDSVIALEEEQVQTQNKLTVFAKDKQARSAENEGLAIESEGLRREQALLNIEDIKDSVQILEQRRREKEEGEKDVTAAQQKCQDLSEKIRNCDRELERMVQAMTGAVSEADRTAVLLDRLQDRAQFEKHNVIKTIIPSRQTGMDASASDWETLLEDWEYRLQELIETVRKGMSLLKETARLSAEVSRREEKLAHITLQRDEQKEELSKAQRMEDDDRDRLIEAFAALPGALKELPLTREDVKRLTSLVTVYQGAQDREPCYRILEACQQSRWQDLSHETARVDAALRTVGDEIQKIEETLAQLRLITEAVPERPDKVDEARRVLAGATIDFLPFYEAVEFVEGVDVTQQALLEMELSDAGLLDALIVAPADREKAKALLGTLSDALIDTDREQVVAPVQELVPADQTTAIGQATAAVLQSFSRTADAEASIVLQADGYYRHGLLEGHSLPEERAVYLGRKARQDALQRHIDDVEKKRGEQEKIADAYRQQRARLAEAEATLQAEYTALPSFHNLDQSIALRQSVQEHCTQIEDAVRLAEAELDQSRAVKIDADRKVIEVCKLLPYGRTQEAYGDAEKALREYGRMLHQLGKSLRTWDRYCRDKAAQAIQRGAYEENRVDAQMQLKRYEQAQKIVLLEITKLEELVNSPENREKAKRHQEITRRLDDIRRIIQQNEIRLGQLIVEARTEEEHLCEVGEKLTIAVDRQKMARTYFQEDWHLTVSETDLSQDDTWAEQLAAAKVAAAQTTAEASALGDMVSSLHNAYQKNSGSLTDYGTALEQYFPEDTSGYQFLRRRFRIVSVWKGKKLYLHDFYQVLSDAIGDMELLIQKKDRELFENILADTLSRKLSNRIVESRQWISDMSRLMMKLDTSMGLNFSLTWKARQREDAEELDVADLEKLLSRDTKLLTQEDMDKVARHFRSRIKRGKETASENGELLNYAELVRDALDYRQWYEFRMSFYRPGEQRRELTNSSFNKFSGGEKALAMYVPLFAAVNAQYRKSDSADYPRIIALDEAFAGVDERNISSMFDLVQQLDFDYVMNSQALWGCYPTVKTLRIAELLRPANSDVVTVVNYEWNGRERVLVS